MSEQEKQEQQQQGQPQSQSSDQQDDKSPAAAAESPAEGTHSATPETKIRGCFDDITPNEGTGTRGGE